MAIGRITGSVLKSNLTRNGVDLAFETNLLYLDVTNSRVGIEVSEPSRELHVNGTITASSRAGLSSLAVAGSQSITGTGVSDSLLTLTTTENSGTASPKLTFKRNSASPADGDELGEIQFLGENSADQEVVYGEITSILSDKTDGTEDGKIQVKLMENGTLANAVRFESNTLF